MRPVIILATVFVATAGNTSALAQESRTSATAIVGAGKTFDDEGSLGSGWLVGGSIDRVLFGTTRGEVSLELLTHSRDVTYFASSGKTVIAGASLVHRFGRRAGQPYLFAGLTAGHHSGTNRFTDSISTLTSTDLGLRFGAGVAIRVGNRFEVSPELRMNGFFIDRDADPAMLPSFGVRLGLRW
jgi:hypothetical protein